MPRDKHRDAQMTNDLSQWQLLEHIRDAVVVTDTQTRRIVMWNAAAVALFGYTLEEARMLMVEDLYPEPLRTQQRDEMQRYSETGHFSTSAAERVMTVAARHKNGDELHVEMTLSPLSQLADGHRLVLATLRDVTARAEAEAASREDHARFLSAFNYAAIGMALVAPDGRWLRVNPALCELTGYSEEELLDLTFQELTHPDDLATDLALSQQLLAGELRTYQLEKRYIHKRRHIVWVLLSVSLVREADGVPLYFISQIQDVTARKQMERRTAVFSALGQQLSMATTAEEVARTLAAASDDLLGWDAYALDRYDADDDRLYSVLTVDVVDGERAEVRPNSSSRPLAGIARRAVHEGGQLVLPAEPSATLEGLQSFGDADRPSASLLFVPVRTGPTVSGVLSIHSYTPQAYTKADLETLQTLADHCAGALARVSAQAMLERERQQLQQVIDVAPVAMAMFDRQMRYLAHSKKWLADNSLPDATLIGRSHYEVFPDLPARYRAIDQRVLTGETLGSAEDVFTWPDGNTTYLRWAATPWYTADGEVGGQVLVTDNIRELVEAREAALEASRAKSAFLATMSHEIRTPMNGVLGMTELLLGTDQTPEQHELTTIVQDSAYSLLRIINDILDFSKIESGKLVLDVAAFSPRALVEGTLDIVALKARDKRLPLLSYVAPELPELLEGDAGRVRQVLLNLVGNAVKFTTQGEVSVWAEIAGENADAVTLRFRVCDSGIGLASEAQARLFQPFAQADSSTTRKYGGSGLGLAISKRLVEVMGGAIGVESMEGQGSTFWFTVPCARVAAATVPAIDARRVGLRVLVIDDTATRREIMGHYLAAWHIRGRSAASSAAGLAMLREAAQRGDPYRLVVVDSDLPDRGATVVCRALQADPLLAGVRAILITGFNQLGPAEVVGFAGIVATPVKQSQLLDAMMTALDQSLASDHDLVARRDGAPAAPMLPATSDQVILVAEDNAVNQQLALMQLRTLGYRSMAVSNGREAVAAAMTGAYALVLMDCQMPEMDGFQATAVIRAGEAGGRRLPIIAMTASAMQGDREECLAAGMDDYVSKPITRARLQEVIEHWLPVLHDRDMPTQREDTRQKIAEHGGDSQISQA